MNNFKKNAIKACLINIFVLLTNNFLFSQVVFDHPISHGSNTNFETTWIVPPNITSITIQAWGGGGGGNGNTALPNDAKVGGGGGSYAKVENVSVTPGQILNISVGRGGRVLESGGFSNTGQPGGVTTVSSSSGTLIRACGGTYMYVIAGWYQEGGVQCLSDSSSIGLVEYGQYNYGMFRFNASIKGGNAGGLADGGGVGGGEGQLGTVPGGGGGGGFNNDAKSGAAGRVIISEGSVLPICEINVTPSSNTICKGDSIFITASGMSYYEWFPANSLSSDTGSTIFAFPNESTTYTVIGYKENCVDSSLVSIIVEDPPIANFNYEVLDETSFIFTNLSEHSASFLWHFGDGNTSTAENPEHVYEQEGVYTVKLFVENNCGVDSAINVVEFLKLNTSKIQQHSFNIYPNPSRGCLFVESTIQGNFYIQIINNLGQIICENKSIIDNQTTMIDVSGIHSGLYYLRIVAESIDVTKKFIVNNEF
jgi:hypothetical protein